VHRNRRCRRTEAESRKQRPSRKRGEFNDVIGEWRHKEKIMILAGRSPLDIEIERDRFFNEG